MAGGFKPEIVFPYLTGIVLFLTVAIILYIYKRVGVPALLVLAIGLLSVALESILDGYEASLVLGYGGWNKVPQNALPGLLALDTVRGIFIVIWAGLEILFVFMLGGVERKSVLYGLPSLVIILGTIQTIVFNYRNEPNLETRIFISSAVRVLVFLVPAALFAGVYVLYRIYMATGTRSSLLYGIGFITHGLTLPFYSLAKEYGPITLGLWYSLGGVIPALLAAVGSWYLEKEMAEAVEAAEEEEEAAEESE